MSEKKLGVIGVGHGCIDMLVNMAELPKENRGARVLDMSLQGGGKVPSAMIATARLGIKTGVIDAYGDDFYGRFCYEDYIRHGINVDRVKLMPGKTTGLSIVLSDIKTMGRSICGYGGADRCPGITIEDVDRDYLRQAEWVNLSGASPLSIQVAKWCKEDGVKVCIDADGYNPAYEEIMPYIDCFIASEFFYKARFGDEEEKDLEANLRVWKAQGPSIVAVTLGEKGVVGLDENDEYYHVEGFTVDVKDTVGAGDVYHGAFVAGLLQGWDVKKVARFSNAVSAIKCTRLGGRAAVPTMETVLKFLDTGVIDYSEIDSRVEYYRQASVRKA